MLTILGIRIAVWYEINENPDMTTTFRNKAGENVSGKISELLEKYNLEEIKSGLQKIVPGEKAVYVVSKEAPGDDFLPETDTFDTWFSSGQWPFVTMLKADSADKEYPQDISERIKEKLADADLYAKYFPTDFLDSMYDIMFFWIARMIMLSKYLTGGVPFKNVYFHGAITDKFGKKMSKSKGNVINPLEYIEKYGADALRMGIMVGGNTEGRMSPLDEDKVRGYRNFANKIWNIARYINMKETEIGSTDLSGFNQAEITKDEDKKIVEMTQNLIKTVTDNLEGYKFKLAGEAVYDFIWNNLANDYMENTKDRKDKKSLEVLKYAFVNALKLLHPFMPFITECVWADLHSEKDASSLAPLIISEWPKA